MSGTSYVFMVEYSTFQNIKSIGKRGVSGSSPRVNSLLQYN